MPTPTIKTKVAMEGEKEYKAALADINSGLKVLSSEMKLTATQFEDNADSMDALTAKGNILERQILSQKEKIETLKAALQNSAEAYGESDKKTSAWKVSLNNAEAELIKMERALEDNQQAIDEAAQAAKDAENAFEDMAEALDESGEEANDNKSIMDKLRESFGDTEGEAKGLGDVAEELAGKLGINLPDGAKNALNALGDVNAETALLVGGAAAAAAAIVEIEKALIELTTEAAAQATELSNLSSTLNMNVESAQKWDYVLKTVGSSLEEAQGDLSAFQEKIMEAATGEGEAAEMFALLNVAVTDQSGVLRSTEEVLMDTIAAMQEMDDVTQRNAASSILLGGTGEKLIPIYEREAGAVEDLMKEKEKLGVMTEEEIAVLGEVSKSLLEYEEKTKSAKNTIAAEFAPALSAFYDAAGDGILQLGRDSESSGLVNFFGSILELLSSLSPALDIVGSALTIATPLFQGLSVAVSVVADTLNVALTALSAFINLITFDFNGAMNDFERIGNVFSGTDSATARAWGNAFNASGDYNFDGGYTWVGENGPELVSLPRGSRIYSNQESRQMSGGDVFYVSIDAKNVKEFNDIVEMAKAQRRMIRMEGR